MEAETKDYLKWLVKTFKSRKYINEQIKIFECKNNIKHRIEAYFNPLENKMLYLKHLGSRRHFSITPPAIIGGRRVTQVRHCYDEENYTNRKDHVMID